ncbi:Xylose isomerase domain-containing protein TIM barrel [Planctomycetales bacterium 10988]|nr:Xylose isomerase domain-containing protein TIM barrel [Planctomycetales bacterium 10988]
MKRRSFMASFGAASAMAWNMMSPFAPAQEPKKKQMGDKTAQPSELKLLYGVNIGSHFRNHPTLKRLELVAEAGFKAVENNGLPNLDREKNATEPNYAAIEEYGEKLRELGLTQGVWVTNACAGPRCDCSMTNPDHHAQYFENLKHTIKIAPLVDGQWSTVTSGVIQPDIPISEQRHSVIEVLKRSAEMVEDSGPMLVLEPLNTLVNHPGYLVVTSEDAYDIMEKVGSPKVKILFDIYHQQISEGNLILNIRNYYDQIGYFQFGDHPGRKEPGTGEINYKNVFKAIYDLGYKGVLGGEYSPYGGGSDEATYASLQGIRDADNWGDTPLLDSRKRR